MPAAAARRCDTRPVLVTIAWRHYLDAVRRCDDSAYEVIEELAWSQLLVQLDRIESNHRYGELRAKAARSQAPLSAETLDR